MTKVITNIEGLKKLAPYLEGIGTEYVMREYDNKIMRNNEICKGESLDWYLETLTLDEALELLPSVIEFKGDVYRLVLGKTEHGYWGNFLLADEDELYILDNNLIGDNYRKESTLSVVEQILEYLIDNNLLLPNPTTNAE